MEISGTSIRGGGFPYHNDDDDDQDHKQQSFALNIINGHN